MRDTWSSKPLKADASTESILLARVKAVGRGKRKEWVRVVYVIVSNASLTLLVMFRSIVSR